MEIERPILRIDTRGKVATLLHRYYADLKRPLITLEDVPNQDEDVQVWDHGRCTQVWEVKNKDLASSLRTGQLEKELSQLTMATQLGYKDTLDGRVLCPELKGARIYCVFRYPNLQYELTQISKYDMKALFVVNRMTNQWCAQTISLLNKYPHVRWTMVETPTKLCDVIVAWSRLGPPTIDPQVPVLVKPEGTHKGLALALSAGLNGLTPALAQYLISSLQSKGVKKVGWDTFRSVPIGVLEEMFQAYYRDHHDRQIKSGRVYDWVNAGDPYKEDEEGVEDD